MRLIQRARSGSGQETVLSETGIPPMNPQSAIPNMTSTLTQRIPNQTPQFPIHTHQSRPGTSQPGHSGCSQPRGMSKDSAIYNPRSTSYQLLSTQHLSESPGYAVSSALAPLHAQGNHQKTLSKRTFPNPPAAGSPTFNFPPNSYHPISSSKQAAFGISELSKGAAAGFGISELSKGAAAGFGISELSKGAAAGFGISELSNGAAAGFEIRELEKGSAARSEKAGGSSNFGVAELSKGTRHDLSQQGSSVDFLASSDYMRRASQFYYPPNKQ